VYTDYAHTPPKIRGALQLTHEVAGDNVVVVYEGLHNTRQHFIKEDLADLFAGIKKVYVVPSYLAREDPNLPLLTPEDLIRLFNTDVQQHAEPASLDDNLLQHIKDHAAAGDLVLCISAGGGGSLDEWLRKNMQQQPTV
jgi:UDP-N-acetylmuramate--alanine ligase